MFGMISIFHSLLGAISPLLATAAGNVDSSRGLVGLGAGLAISIAAGLGGLGIGIASGKAFEATARQPEQAGGIQRLLFVAIVFIESTTIYALVVALLLLFVFN